MVVAEAAEEAEVEGLFKVGNINKKKEMTIHYGMDCFRDYSSYYTIRNSCL